MFSLKFVIIAMAIIFVTGNQSCDKENQMMKDKLSNFCRETCKSMCNHGHTPSKTVAFTAFLTSSSTYSANQVVKYNNVVTNIGSAYNKLTGYFKAPVTGLYSLSVSLMGTPGKGVHLNVMVAGKQLMRLYTHGGGRYEVSSHTVYKKLKRGDLVWTTPRYTVTLYGSGSDAYNQFSAVLLKRL